MKKIFEVTELKSGIKNIFLNFKNTRKKENQEKKNYDSI